MNVLHLQKAKSRTRKAPSGYIGLFHNEWKNEINIKILYTTGSSLEEVVSGSRENDLSFLLVVLAYRFYHSGLFSDFGILKGETATTLFRSKGKGIFYEASLGVRFISGIMMVKMSLDSHISQQLA